MAAAAKKRSNAPTFIDIEVSQRIKTLRSMKGMTQSAVARELGLVHQQFHKYEAGILRFSAGLLVKLADVFDCQVQDLFPPELRGDGEVEPDIRVDALKQELISMIMDMSVESELMALRTLLLGLTRNQADADRA